MGHHLPDVTNLSTHVLNVTYSWEIDEQGNISCYVIA